MFGIIKAVAVDVISRSSPVNCDASQASSSAARIDYDFA
jgi:hypothetical protein